MVAARAGAVVADPVSGQALSRAFFEDEVRPILRARAPDLAYAAALLGRGSEVLGYDDAMSRDHDWGARVLVLLRDEDDAERGESLAAALRASAPDRYAGHVTSCHVSTPRRLVRKVLDVDIEEELRPRDWLTLPEHHLLTLTAGAVFHDEIGLQAVRDRLAYYPHDVWLYLMLGAWWRVHPEQNLVGRTGYVGDERGSALIASQLVHDLMRLAFLQERRYAPYAKWWGTAFARLDTARRLGPILDEVLRAEHWRDRERALAAAYAHLAERHEALAVTDPVPVVPERMWDRPFAVEWGDFPGALHARIADPEVVAIADRWPLGEVAGLRDVLWGARTRRRLLRLFEPDG